MKSSEMQNRSLLANEYDQSIRERVKRQQLEKDDIVTHGNSMIQNAQKSLKQEKNFKDQKLYEYRKAFKADFNMKQMMRQKQKELDQRLKDEHNMLFLKRAEQEINREKEYKQRFIDCNRVQMIRSRAYLNSIGSYNDSDNNNIKIIKLKRSNGGVPSNDFTNNRGNMNASAMSGSRKLLLNQSNDNIYQNEKYYSMEEENSSLEAVRQNEYKKILDSQIKLK